MFGSSPFGATSFAGGPSAQEAPVATPNLSLFVTDAADVLVATGQVVVSVSASIADQSDVLLSQVFVSEFAPVVVALAVQDAPDVLMAAVAVGSPVLVNLTVTDAPDTLRATVSLPQSVRLSLAVFDAPDMLHATTTTSRPIFGAIPRCRPVHKHSHRRPPNVQSRC